MRPLLILSLVFIAGCAEHKVDTFAEWCEQITGVDLQKKYTPFWAVSLGVSFDGEAIRDSYAEFLNKSHLHAVQNRTPRMAWREGTALHLINISSFLEVEAKQTIDEWRNGIDADKAGKLRKQPERCIFGTLTSMFDSLHIHSMTSDSIGSNWTDSVTVVRTDREKRLGDKRL
jgi:hypothetical protein